MFLLKYFFFVSFFNILYSLSRYCDKSGKPSFNPLRLRVSWGTNKIKKINHLNKMFFIPTVIRALTWTIWYGRVPNSKGLPGRTCQWSNTHCGNAWPPVLLRKSAVKPEKKATFSIEIEFQTYKWRSLEWFNFYTDRTIHLQANKLWRRTLVFQEPAFLRRHGHDVCSAHHRFHLQQFLGTEKSQDWSDWAQGRHIRNNEKVQKRVSSHNFQTIKWALRWKMKSFSGRKIKGSLSK